MHPQLVLYISCKCCGEGLLEIKCPYKYREQDPTTMVDSKFCLQPDVRGDVRLSQKHDYYLQVQGQLAICNKEYCDFICLTPHGMHVERIVRNAAAFDAIRPSLDAFFKDVLLPWLLRGQSSNKENKTPNTSCSDGSSNTGTKYCWCQQGSMGEWLHVTILSVLGNGSTIDVLDLLVNHVANGIVVTYVRIIIESVIIESVCSLIKKQASLILILKFN